MARGIFLTDPELSNDNVTISATSELGRRAGAPIAFANNSGLLSVTTIGDAGDDLAHDFRILGSQDLPKYTPLTSGGADQFTAPETFATVGSTIACGATAQVALCATDDRLYAIMVSGATLTIRVWDGSAWTLKASIGPLVDASGGIAAAAIGENIYIVVGNNTDAVIELYRFGTRSSTIGVISQSLVVTDATTIAGLAFATNGAVFSLLVTRNASGFDVDPYFGSFGDLTKNDKTINDMFGTAWSSGGDVRACGMTFCKGYGYVAAFRTGTGTSKLKLLTSSDGDNWREFRNIKKAVAQPTITTPWGDGLCCGVGAEFRRIYVWRATAASLGGASTDIKLQWFDGDKTWSAEVDVDGGAGVHTGTPVAAAVWRGATYVAWRASSSTIVVRKGNALTTTNTGIYRELSLGDQMFIAGLDDDTRTALFFVATGSIRAGDKFRITAAEYDYRVAHLLDDFLMKVWRGAQGAQQIVQFDAGSGRAFFLDAIAIVDSNLPSITVQLDDDVAFGSPSTNQVLLATVQSAAITAADRNRILFADDTFRHRQYAADGGAKHWVTLSNGVRRILDNTHNALIIDGSGTGASGTATIFRDSMGYLFSATQTAGRYLRLLTPTVTLPDGYYQISRVLFGLRLSLLRNFSSGFTREDLQIETRTELKSGARFMTNLNHRQRQGFALPWQVVQLDKHVRTLRGLYARTKGGRNLTAFWPLPTADTGDQPELYLGRFVEALSVDHINKDFYSIGGMRFETEV